MRRQTQPISPFKDEFPTYRRTHTSSTSHFSPDDIEARIRRTNSYSLLPSSTVPRTSHRPRSRLKRMLHSILHLPRIWKSRIRFALLLLLALLVLDAYRISSHRPKGTRVIPQSMSLSTPKPRLYIAGIHRNSEKILRSHWNAAVLELVKFYGADNVFVSLYESGSIEDTKTALSQLDDALKWRGVRTSIVLDEADQILEVEKEVNSEEEGWVFTSRGKYELRRIPYLASLRNRVMENLITEEKAGRSYDFVLWLNDVVFNTEDVVTLLSTNNGTFDAACSLDFKKPHQYYDTFALRSLQGSKVSNTWPYFADSLSRRALRDLEAIQVSSCWNGIVAFPAESFYGGLRFRGVSDDLARMHLEGSECCLVHVDNELQRGHMHGSSGTWLNPNVRVAYSGPVYERVNQKHGIWPGGREKIVGIWSMRLGGLVARIRRWVERRVISRRLDDWKQTMSEKQTIYQHEVGEHCLINEMQVLEGAGWRHL